MTMIKTLRIAAALTLFVCIAVTGRATAGTGDKATAEAAFQHAKALMKSGNYADACVAFEQSQSLDPQLGTEYNLGLCYEKVGRLASAWGVFRELAQRDTNPARQADAGQRAQALQPRLIKLLISVRAALPGLKITRNDEDVSRAIGIESPVDPGDYRIAATAEGHTPWSVTVSAAHEGGTVEITVPELARLPVAGTPASGTHASPTSPTSDDRAAPVTVAATSSAPASHRTLALVVGGSGLVAVAGGLVFGALASSKWSDVKHACGGDPRSHCDATGAALDAAHRDQRSASTLGTTSTVLVGVGAAAVTAGVVLYVLAPARHTGEHAMRWIPSLTGDGVALTAAGRF